MRHRNHGRKLGRTSAHRRALFRNQLTALFAHERITTTLEKAKELRPIAERMVTLARTGSLPARRKVLTMVFDKDVVHRLFEDIAPRFSERPGGYTRILRLGRRRGDGAELAIIEFVDYELKVKDEGPEKQGKKSLKDRAKSMFGGGGDKGQAAPEPVAAGEAVEEAAEAEVPAEAEAKPKKRTRTKKAEPPAEAATAEDAAAEAKPKRRTRKKKEETEKDAE